MMRPVMLWMLMAALLCAPAAMAAENLAAPFPVTVVPEWRYDFDPVVEGSAVMHDFVIQNKGSAPLNVLEVKTA